MALHKRDNQRGCWRSASGRSLRVFAVLLVLALVFVAGCAVPASTNEGPDDIEQTSWFSIKMSIMTTCVQFLIVVAVVLLYHKMNQLVAKIDDISKDASKFLRMGMTYFKKK